MKSLFFFKNTTENCTVFTLTVFQSFNLVYSVVIKSSSEVFKPTFCVLVTLLLLSLTGVPSYAGVTKAPYTAIVQSENSLKLTLDFRNRYVLKDTIIDRVIYQTINSSDPCLSEAGSPWLPSLYSTISVPYHAQTQLSITAIEEGEISGVNIIPFPKPVIEGKQPILELMNREVYSKNGFFPTEIAKIEQPYQMRFAKIAPVIVNPYRYNPVTRTLKVVKTITITITFINTDVHSSILTPVQDRMSEEYIQTTVLNFNQGKRWLMEEKKISADKVEQSYWYNPSKNYYKLYLRQKGVYKVSYSELVAAGVPLAGGVAARKLELFSNEQSVPIDVEDGGDSVFGPGDYIRFVGLPAPASPYTKQNLYNTYNLYWFSYQADSTAKRYARKDGTPVPVPFQNVISGHYRTDFYERDSIYERLGYAPDGQRDYWFWGRASAVDSVILQRFAARFEQFKNSSTNFPVARLRVSMHGMTNFGCFYDHKARIFINRKVVGIAEWNGQNEFVFEKSFYVGPDSIQIYPSGNELIVEVDGKICHSSKSDEIRINWFELTYYSDMRLGTDNSIDFVNPENSFGQNVYWTFNWSLDSTVNIFIPSKEKMYYKAALLNDVFKSVQFADSVEPGVKTEYYAINANGYLNVDSIRADAPSTLRSLANGADYIILYHRKFETTANRLKAFRESRALDSAITNPRIFKAEVQEIYDEFSGGLLNPFALQKFVKYAFENWVSPKPSYVVILGDMSYDYKKQVTGSRENYVPAIPHHSFTYGIAASDNGIVAVSGDDIVPDIAVGRLSIETLEEGDILLSKLENYPLDNGKEWKDKILLMASGLNEEDEQSFGFNDKSLILKDEYIDPWGASTKMIFRYPTRATHIPFQGGTVDIRSAFDAGTVLANYYGHGGGYQWDQTFLNDDIYLLQNGGRLPLVLSVTCYTAHFDNQDVFGEQFNKIPGRGSIGFFGSSGLTHWQIGEFINQLNFKEIFRNKRYVTGKAFLYAKAQVPLFTFYVNQIALLTYLGDPAMELALPKYPEFTLKQSDIILNPEIPVVDDSVEVKIKVTNLGPFASDSVSVELKFVSNDTSGTLGVKKIAPFGNLDSVSFKWQPKRGGLYQLQAIVNDDARIIEGDFTDNKATLSVGVFNISEPSVIVPRDGALSGSTSVRFRFADIGYYIGKNFTYSIEIDTSREFTTPLFTSPALVPQNGYLVWNSPELPLDNYYWRARIFDGANYGRWTNLRALTIGTKDKAGYNVSGRLLSLLNNDNLKLNSGNTALILNTNLNLPKPTRSRMLEDIMIDSARFFYRFALSALTTDGTYAYIGNMFYYQAVLHNDTTGTSPIFRFGTGYNGTIKGQMYDSIPGFKKRIAEMIAYHGDGYIYVPFGDPYKIMKVNPASGRVDTIAVPAGLIDKFSAKPIEGSFYIASDSQYIYNLAIRDTLGNNRYSLRVFDPANNWQVVLDKTYPNSISYPRFCNFFVHKGYFYPFENQTAAYMRRIRISDGVYEQEWNAWDDPRPELFYKHYAWTYDWTNDVVYASIWKQNYYWLPGFTKFKGTYYDASGHFTSEPVGPVSKWEKIEHSVLTGSPSSRYSLSVDGFNTRTRRWDTLAVNIPQVFSVASLNPDTISQIRVRGTFTDTSLTGTVPIGLQSLGIGYEELPDAALTANNIVISPDSSLQGIPLTVSGSILNSGGSIVDTLTLSVSRDTRDSILFSQQFTRVIPDSLARFSFTLNTSDLLFGHELKFIAKTPETELFTFNNILKKPFYVARDSVNPNFTITFDGKEILNGDVVSKNPLIYMSLEDNGPLPLDTTMFTLIFDNISLGFKKDSLSYTYRPYPASKAEITWQPLLKKGRHTLDVLAKDASGNFFDTVYNRTIFNIFEENDIAFIYNYPNPFSGGTTFTFELRGKEKPEAIEIKIFTVAGRLMKQLRFNANQLGFNFNRLYWDGKDEDGNEIANGVYFYRIITKYPGKTLSSINKLVKMR